MTKKLLTRMGWKVTNAENHRYDYGISCETVSFSLIFIDSSTTKFNSFSQILESMCQETRWFRVSGSAPLIYITNFSFPMDFKSALLKNDVISLHSDELDLLYNLKRCFDDLPTDTEDQRQIKMLKTQWKICLLFSKRFADRQNLSKAICWAKIAVDASKGAPFAYERLINILLHAEHINEASEVMDVALEAHPREVVLLRQKIKMVRSAAQPQDITVWEERLRAALAERVIQPVAPTAPDKQSESENMQGRICAIPNTKEKRMKSFFSKIIKRTY
jgi:hypothetical protein